MSCHSTWAPIVEHGGRVWGGGGGGGPLTFALCLYFHILVFGGLKKKMDKKGSVVPFRVGECLMGFIWAALYTHKCVCHVVHAVCLTIWTWEIDLIIHYGGRILSINTITEFLSLNLRHSATQKHKTKSRRDPQQKHFISLFIFCSHFLGYGLIRTEITDTFWWGGEEWGTQAVHKWMVIKGDRWGSAEATWRSSQWFSPRSGFPAAEDSCHLYQAHLNQLEIRNESCYIQRICPDLQRIAEGDQKNSTVLTLDIQTVWFGVSLQGYVPGMVVLPSAPIRKASQATCPVGINQVNTGKPVVLFQPLRVRLT